MAWCSFLCIPWGNFTCWRSPWANKTFDPLPQGKPQLINSDLCCYITGTNLHWSLPADQAQEKGWDIVCVCVSTANPNIPNHNIIHGPIYPPFPHIYPLLHCTVPNIQIHVASQQEGSSSVTAAFLPVLQIGTQSQIASWHFHNSLCQQRTCSASARNEKDWSKTVFRWCLESPSQAFRFPIISIFFLQWTFTLISAATEFFPKHEYETCPAKVQMESLYGGLYLEYLSGKARLKC